MTGVELKLLAREILKDFPAIADMIRDWDKHRRRVASQIIATDLRARLSTGLRRGKLTQKIADLVGCGCQQLKSHLESTWKQGMTWDNYGLGSGHWQIDHVIPCSRFDLTSEAERTECFALTNIRALWHWENQAKGDSTEEEMALHDWGVA